LESLYGEDDSRVAKAIRYRGNTYSFLHQPELALADAQRAAELQSRVVGPNHPGLAELYSNIGADLGELSRWGEAKAAFVHALELQVGMAPGGATVLILRQSRRGRDRARQCDAALDIVDKGMLLVEQLGCGATTNPILPASSCALGAKGDLRPSRM
jgi:hypothetical protein